MNVWEGRVRCGAARPVSEWTADLEVLLWCEALGLEWERDRGVTMGRAYWRASGGDNQGPAPHPGWFNRDGGCGPGMRGHRAASVTPAVWTLSHLTTCSPVSCLSVSVTANARTSP